MKLKSTILVISFAVIAILIGSLPSIECQNLKITDGDTFSCSGKKIRLYEIDSPEISQKCKNEPGKSWRCGLEAKKYLEELARNKEIFCFQVDQDRYGREVSICYNNKFQSLNSEMVRAGYAIAYVKYSKMYLEEEREAKKNKKGIWVGEFIYPEEYRKNQRKKR